MRLARDRSPSPERAGLVAAAPPSAPPSAPPASPPDHAELDAHERSYCEFYYRHHPRLLAVAERYVDRETARDVESETMMDLWRRWPQLTAAQRADEYVDRAVKNTALDALKAQGAWVSLDEAEEALDRHAVADHDATSRAESLTEVLEATLAAMPPGRRAVLRLLNEERLTYREAAKTLGLSFGTIKTHYRLAIADLRAAYARAGHRIGGPARALLPAPNGGADHD